MPNTKTPIKKKFEKDFASRVSEELNDDEMEFWSGVEFESRVSEELNDDEIKFWNGAADDFRNEMFIIMQRKGMDVSIAEIKEGFSND